MNLKPLVLAANFQDISQHLTMNMNKLIFAPILCLTFTTVSAREFKKTQVAVFTPRLSIPAKSGVNWNISQKLSSYINIFSWSAAFSAQKRKAVTVIHIRMELAILELSMDPLKVYPLQQKLLVSLMLKVTNEWYFSNIIGIIYSVNVNIYIYVCRIFWQSVWWQADHCHASLGSWIWGVSWFLYPLPGGGKQ